MPKKVDHAHRRAAFCAAASRLIKSGGFASATARAIAKEAGFTTGALQHYVRSIDELLVDATERVLDQLRAKADTAEQQPRKLKALREVLYLTLCGDVDQRGNWNFFLSCWERSMYDEGVRKLTHLSYAEWIDRIEKLVGLAMANGEIPDDVDIKGASRACVALIDGIAVQVLRSGRPLSAKAQKSMVDSWISHRLRPKK